MKKRKLIADIIGVLIAFLVIEESLRFLTSDFTISLIPGWHTTIYPRKWLLAVATIVLLGLTYLISKLVIFTRRISLKIIDRLLKPEKTNSKWKISKLWNCLKYIKGDILQIGFNPIVNKDTCIIEKQYRHPRIKNQKSVGRQKTNEYGFIKNWKHQLENKNTTPQQTIYAIKKRRIL